MNVYDQLRSSLHATVEYPAELRQLIGQAEPWRAFCMLPEDTKQRFAFLQHETDAIAPGYRNRGQDANPNRDQKSYFHYTLGNQGLVARDGLLSIVDRIPAVRNFFAYAQEVEHTVFDFALQIARGMEGFLPGLAAHVRSGRSHCAWRYLYYPVRPPGTILGSQHFDRSGFTLHLYESCPGLEFLDWNVQWRPAPITNKETVIFNGYKMEVITGGELQKTWHRVVQTPATQPRYSMIFFVPLVEIPDYPPEARSQDLQPSYALRK